MKMHILTTFSGWEKMNYIILVLILSLLFTGCIDKNNSDAESLKKVDEKFTNLMTEDEWHIFFLSIKESGFEYVSLEIVNGRNTLQTTLDKAAEKYGFSWRGGRSIKDNNGFETIGGIDVYAFEDSSFVIYEEKKGRIDGKPVWELKDFLFIPVNSSSFDFAEAKTDEMSNYNKERNIWGLFYWDSPLIQPDVEIPAEKVIIIDIDTSTMTLKDNENGEYKIFIDAAFLE
jgi:hypothetical protein